MGPRRIIRNLFGRTNDKSSHRSHPRETLSGFGSILHCSLRMNVQAIREWISSDDLMIREIQIGSQPREAAVLCLEGMVDKATLNNHVLEPLLRRSAHLDDSTSPYTIRVETLSVGSVSQTKEFSQVIDGLVDGHVILLLDGYADALVIQGEEYEHRAIAQSESERAVRGARDGFIEVADVNISLIRRRLRDERLRVSHVLVGRRSRTRVSVLHIDGIADPEIVGDVINRLERIDIDGVLTSGTVEEFLTKPGGLLFPLIQATERPDKTSAGLLEGQVAVIIDHSPFVLLLPVTLFSLFQAADDYNHRPIAATFMRGLRVVGWVAGLYSPSLYVALTMVNPEVIPLSLTIVVANSREGVPYPPVFEALVMVLAVELLAEASTRLPAFIGPTATVVGGLIIGTAAAEAKVISNIMIIATAVMAIGTFTMPYFDLGLAWRVVRVGFIVASAAFGIFGITVATLLLIVYLASVKSFGVPYLSPVGPFVLGDMQDTPIIAMPWWLLRHRPKAYRSIDSVRQEPRDRSGEDGDA